MAFSWVLIINSAVQLLLLLLSSYLHHSGVYQTSSLLALSVCGNSRLGDTGPGGPTRGVVNRGLGLPLYRSPLVTWKWCAYKSPTVILLSQGREIVIIGWRGRSWRYVWRRRQREQEIAIRRHMLLLNLNFDGSCQCSIMVLECAVLLSSVCGRDFFWNWNNAGKWLTWG